MSADLFGEEPAPTKRCIDCKQHLPRAAFDPLRKAGRDYLQSRCKACAKVCRSRYNRTSKGKRKTHLRNLLKGYGITVAEYDALLAGQGGLCAICRQPETRKGPFGGVRRLGVDHCHKTGRVRGLLCHRCNSAIGYFDDDPSLLRVAISYLEMA